MTNTTLQNLAISYVCLWATAPVLAYGTEYRILAILAVVIWVGLELGRSRSIIKRPTLPVALTLIFIGYTGFLEFMLSGAVDLLSHLQLWIMLFFLLVHQSRRDDMQSLVPVFWFVLATLPLWLFFTSYTLINVDPHAARTLVRSSEEAKRLTGQGIGGYSLVYGALLMLPGLFGMVLAGRRLERARLPYLLKLAPRLAQGLLLLNIALGLMVILTAGFTIAVVILMFALLCIFFLKRYSAWRVMLACFFAVLALILYRPLLEWALLSLQPLVEDTAFSHKVRDLLVSLHIDEAVGTVEDRAERYMRSLILFLESPFFGVLVVDDVGKHSEILDTYARWGIVFGSIFVYLISFLPMREMRKLTSNFGAPFATLVVVAFIFGLNNAFSAAGVMLYIMFPVATYLLARMEPRELRYA
ncbi:MAG: hypothetical protein JKY88_08895 [Pseudomonadales bacterium]|nr:hypothetical protein [Pseudomonadales bacterium]